MRNPRKSAGVTVVLVAEVEEARFHLAAAAGVLLERPDPVLVDAPQLEPVVGLPVLGSTARIG